MKKGFALLSIFFTLVSCGSKVPKEIQDFLSQAILTKPETVKSGHFNQEVNEVVGGQTGKSTIDFDFHYTSSSDFGFTAEYKYEGIKIQEGITYRYIKLEFISERGLSKIRFIFKNKKYIFDNLIKRVKILYEEICKMFHGRYRLDVGVTSRTWNIK